MATRFYLPSTGAAPVTPPALPSGWSAGQTAAIERPAPTTKSDTALTDFLVGEITASTLNVPVGVFISAPLAAQSISGDVTAVVRAIEGASSSDDSLQVGVYLISGDGTTVKSTLYAGHTEALTTTAGVLGQEIASAAQQTRIIPATALTGQTAASGDRLMILVGYRTHDISATSRTSTLRLGDPAATADFALTSGLTTDLVPWVELSATLTWAGSAATVPVGQATETDTTQAIGRQKSRAVAQAVETDTAGTVGRQKVRTVGQAVETDAAGTVRVVRLVAVAQALEVDTAQSVTVAGGADPSATGPRITSRTTPGHITAGTAAGRHITTSARGRL